MTEYLPALLLAWGIQLTGVLSPGPSVALILGVATGQGRGPAMVTALGIGSASIVLSLATVLGLAALFAQAAEVVTLVRILGAAYLLWLAYGAFRKAVEPPPVPEARRLATPPARLATMGFLMQVSNPKSLFFWLAIASVGGIGDAPPAVVALFVLGAFVNSAGGHLLWALILSSAPVRMAYLSARRPIEAALGAFFAYAAFRVATERA